MREPLIAERITVKIPTLFCLFIEIKVLLIRLREWAVCYIFDEKTEFFCDFSFDLDLYKFYFSSRWKV
jgi:hypothetical protein